MFEINLCDNRAVWDDFILDSGGHPLQLWGWGQLKTDHGWRCDRFLARLDGKPVMALSVLTKKLPKPFGAMCYVPRGRFNSGKYSIEFINYVTDYLRKNYKPVVLTFEPDSEDFETIKGWRKSTNEILKPLTIQLDLTKTEAELLAGMAKKTRQYIRKSTSDIQITKAKNREEISALLEIYRETSKRANFSLHSDDYYHDVFNYLNQNNLVYVALVDKKPVAFLWLAVGTKTAYELYGGMNNLGSELRANYALKWKAIRDCKEWGLEVYDFGGLLETGVSTFKRNWSQEDTVLPGTFDLPMSKYYMLWSKLLPSVKQTIQKFKKLGRN